MAEQRESLEVQLRQVEKERIEAISAANAEIAEQTRRLHEADAKIEDLQMNVNRLMDERKEQVERAQKFADQIEADRQESLKALMDEKQLAERQLAEHIEESERTANEEKERRIQHTSQVHIHTYIHTRARTAAKQRTTTRTPRGQQARTAHLTHPTLPPS